MLYFVERRRFLVVYCVHRGQSRVHLFGAAFFASLSRGVRLSLRNFVVRFILTWRKAQFVSIRTVLILNLSQNSHTVHSVLFVIDLHFLHRFQFVFFVALSQICIIHQLTRCVSILWLFLETSLNDLT